MLVSRNQVWSFVERLRVVSMLLLLPALAALLWPVPAARAGSAELEALVDEAMRQSPMVMAARERWNAAGKMPIQAATLPDPQLQLQNLAVGSPRPFAGTSSSDFAYGAVGVSQDIPFPGKLGLQGELARRDAEIARHQYEAARREVAEKVRESYFELYYLGNTVELLGRMREELSALARIAESRYRVGEAQQQDVLKAELQMTALLEELVLHRQHMEQRQADLKAALGRSVDSADIPIEKQAPTELKLASSELVKMADAGSPEIAAANVAQRRSEDSLKLARKGYGPDFNFQYMYQHTGPGFRDYYLLTLGAKIPLYAWRKQTPAIEQAELELEAAGAERRARQLDVTAEADKQLAAFNAAGRIIRLYREGLIPQAENARDAALAGYRTGKVDFDALLTAFVDLLRLNEEYYREFADHEIAAAKLQQILGVMP